MKVTRLTLSLIGCLPLLVLNSCASSGSTGFLLRTSSAANDHIMLVREKPPTFGFHRLIALSRNYPDLGIFIQSKGFPTFLAETQKGQNRYLILYYPEIRQAFACRSDTQSSRQIEFSGPYPITEGELRTLGKLQGGGNSAPLR